MKKWPLLLAGTIEALLVFSAVYFEPSFCVRGRLHGEAFYDGRPTSYWAGEIERWQSASTICEVENYERRSAWPRFLRGHVPEPTAAWPRLLDGAADGLPVLRELQAHPSATVRDWARVGIERINNDERGPTEDVAGK